LVFVFFDGVDDVEDFLYEVLFVLEEIVAVDVEEEFHVFFVGDVEDGVEDVGVEDVVVFVEVVGVVVHFHLFLQVDHSLFFLDVSVDVFSFENGCVVRVDFRVGVVVFEKFREANDAFFEFVETL
jgi:hypothetical protein